MPISCGFAFMERLQVEYSRGAKAATLEVERRQQVESSLRLSEQAIYAQNIEFLKETLLLKRTEIETVKKERDDALEKLKELDPAARLQSIELVLFHSSYHEEHLIIYFTMRIFTCIWSL